jgi:hypothetical protein
MSKEKIIERITHSIYINGQWVNHGMVGSTLMIPVSKALSIIKEELEEKEKASISKKKVK